MGHEGSKDDKLSKGTYKAPASQPKGPSSKMAENSHSSKLTGAKKPPSSPKTPTVGRQ
jgi:hypothetical protein